MHKQAQSDTKKCKNAKLSKIKLQLSRRLQEPSLMSYNCTIRVHNMAQDSPDNHHSSDVSCSGEVLLTNRKINTQKTHH